MGLGVGHTAHLIDEICRQGQVTQAVWAQCHAAMVGSWVLLWSH